jgi:hypothetical protein
MGNPLGRPAYTPSRRRYAEAIRALKRILKQDKQTAVILLRATELLLLIYGQTLPGGLDKRDKRAVTELVTESNLERSINRQIDADLDAQAIQRQERADAATLESTRAMFDAVLAEVGDD